jgi:hypothetical protein
MILAGPVSDLKMKRKREFIDSSANDSLPPKKDYSSLGQPAVFFLHCNHGLKEFLWSPRVRLSDQRLHRVSKDYCGRRSAQRKKRKEGDNGGVQRFPELLQLNAQ